MKDAADNENIWEEVLKPEYESGRRFVEWLGRKLPYLEVYAVLLEINFTISFKKKFGKYMYILNQFLSNIDLLQPLLLEMQFTAISTESGVRRNLNLN